MTDNEIIKAFEHLVKNADNHIPITGKMLLEDVLGVLNRLKSANEKNERIIEISDKTIKVQSAEIEKKHKIVCDYAQAARTIELYLRDFCNKKLPYDEMIADASRKASAEIERLKNQKCLYAFDGEFKDCIKADCFYRKKEDEVKSEAIKEFVKKFEKKIKDVKFTLGQTWEIQNALKNTLKQMVGDDNA